MFTYIHGEQQPVPLITEIGLIESSQGTETAAPRLLIIGIEATREIFYKLSDGRKIIKGGRFLRGYNSFSIDVGDFFERSGTHSYALELKADSQVTQKRFEIDVRLQESESQKEEPDEVVLKYENIVSMYVGQRLIVSNRKLYTTELAEKIKAIPRPYSIDPNDSAAEPSLKNTGGVPILEAVAAAVSVVKGLFDKKNEEDPVTPIRKKMRITKHIIRNDPEKGETSVTAVISLRPDSDFY
jgi:hypothetical protein